MFTQAFIDQAAFQTEVLDNERHVIAAFEAPWCTVCKLQQGVFTQVAPEYADTVDIVRFDVEEAATLKTAQRIRVIPTLILFKDGKRLDHWEGVIGPSELRVWLSKYL